MNWQRIRSIIRKEVAQIFRDRRTLTSILMLPVIQLALYGYLSYEVLHQPTVLWDESQTAESRALVSAFENTRYFSIRSRAGSMAEIEREIDAGRANAGIVIPPDYGALVRSGRPAAVLVIVDASNATTSGAVLSAAAGVGTRISQDLLVRTVERRGQRVPSGVVDVRTRAWYNPDLKSRIFIVPGVLGVILQFTTTFLSIAVIVRERELGTLEQLVVTPIRPVELMVGKIIPLIGLGYLNMTLILVLAWFWFGVVVKGSVLLLYVLALAFFFSALGTGTLISTVSKNFQQALQLGQLTLLPSIFISGFLFPRESLPTFLQWVGYVVPLTYFVTVIRGIIIKGVGFVYLWQQIVPLVVLGGIIFALAIRRFQKKID